MVAPSLPGLPGGTHHHNSYHSDICNHSGLAKDFNMLHVAGQNAHLPHK